MTRAAPAQADLLLSVVVPVYGCAHDLPELHRRLCAALEGELEPFEVVFVDDRSPDGAWEAIERLAGADRRVRGIRLSRNFGQHAAITAGLAESRGEWTVVMDCDLQEPPEAIPRLFERAREGCDVVHTRRYRAQAPLRRVGGAFYFALRNRLLETRTGTNHGTLSLLHRNVVDSFLRLRDQHREYLVALDWLGFESATVAIEASPRPAGRSSYTLRKLIRVAVDGMFFQTTVLLRWVVGLGFVVTTAGIGLAVYDLYVALTDDPLPGYASLAVLLLVLAGLIIVSLGLIGLYVGKVFEQVKERPLFLVDRRLPEDGGP